jgi:hypothetical protein
MFVGTDLDQLEVYPIKTESQNGTVLHDFTWQIGSPTNLKAPML